MMIGKWFGKMKEIFFGEEIHMEENHQSETKKSPGRIINSDYNIEPKVINRYPEGKFRFPVIPDEEVRREIKPTNLKPIGEKRKINPQPVPAQQRTSDVKVETYPKREKFAGRNFKARDIPSPVYGFGERTLLLQKETDELDQYIAVDEVQYFQQEPEEVALEVERPIHMEFDLVEPEITYVHEEISGSEAVVSGSEAVVSGSEALVSGSEAVVSGSEAVVSGSEAVVSGSEAVVSGSEAVVSGSETVVSDSEAVGSGSETVVSGSGAPTPKTTERKPKNHVPFNVLMLKQDRRNIQPSGSSYQFPPIHLLVQPSYSAETDAEWLTQQKELLQSTLQNFNVKAAVIGAIQGPAVTRLEVQPSPGVKVSKITNLSDDIKLSLSARDIRIEAPIPGRNAVGIEVPNLKSRPVPLREIIQSKEFRASESPLTVALGLDISGQPVVTDLQKMPHGLIAGATGSGKSVCINSILISLFYKADPDEVKLLLVDPKMVELAPYNRIPHLVTPVITDAKEATNALKWTVDEMERRYEEFSHTGVRDIKKFNEVASSRGKEKLPYIVVIIDELADLMMVSPHDVEEAICRIAQKARACGIHLLLATQRPSVDVITGLIKANIPTRTAFSVSSQVDSRTIIDTAGAEKLLGKGDMLFLGNGTSKPQRIQGTFVSDEEIERITSHLRKQKEPEYLFEKEILVQQNAFGDFEDDLFLEACEFVLEQGAASSSALQRRFRIGFNRAARLVEMMESKGIVSEAMGSKPRSVLISKEEYEEQVLDS